MTWPRTRPSACANSPISPCALSPGINDPTTAVTCIRYLTAILEDLTGRPGAPDLHHFADGALVVVTRARPYGDYVEMLVEVSRCCRDDTRVTAALLAALIQAMEVANVNQAHDRLALLAATARTVAAAVLDTLRTDQERCPLREQLERVTVLEQAVGSQPSVHRFPGETEPGTPRWDVAQAHPGTKERQP